MGIITEHLQENDFPLKSELKSKQASKTHAGLISFSIKFYFLNFNYLITYPK